MSGAGSRLFVAVPVTPALAAQVQELPRTLPQARWVAAEALHITLRFLGDVEMARIDDVADALARVRKKPFHIDVRGLGLFDQPGDRVLYARVESARNMTDLCARVTEALTPLGFDFGARAYVPHVTLARLAAGPAADKYIKNHSKSVGCSWLAEGFSLYLSGGVAAPAAGYQVLADYLLRS